MHISDVSGHRCASLAIERALQEVDGGVQTKSIDAFSYTNPRLERFIDKLYMFVIKAVPGFWEYLYDNQDILKKTKKVWPLLHRTNERKIEELFKEFSPHIVVCTQAFPCAMVAHYKRKQNLSLPLMGVLTDYAPHSYWLNDAVDAYVVPTEKVEQKLMQRGISKTRLQVCGIPIDSKFRKQTNHEEVFRRLGLDYHLPIVLIMGGGQGLGPIKEIAQTLDRLSVSVQLVIVCGTNQKLYSWLNKNKSCFTKPVLVIGYTEEVDDLMAVSSFVVTKPGGLTSAEALSKSLPMIIVNPLPGQETHNTRFLLEAGVALKADDLTRLKDLAQELLDNPAKLDELRKKAASIASADSALKIARLILKMIKQKRSDN